MRLPNLGEAPVPRPDGLLRVAAAVEQHTRLGSVPRHPFPVRVVQTLLETGVGDLTLLEWSLLLRDKQGWDSLSEDAQGQLAELCRERMASDAAMARLYLRCRLAKRYEDGWMPRPLINVPKGWRPAAPARRTYQWTVWLLKEKTGRVAEVLRERRWRIGMGFRQVGLVPLRALRKAVGRAIGHLGPRNEADAAWMAGVLEDEPSESADEVVEGLVRRHAPTKEKRPLLAPVLARRWGPAGPTRHRFLSDEAREGLARWLSSGAYADVETIARSLLRSTLGLTEWEQNQLRKRVMFWSVYQTRLRGLRLLLPDLSRRAIHTHLRELVTGDVAPLDTGGCENTEVLVLHFDKLVVVEVLRGEVSETRLLRDLPDLTAALAQSPVSLATLRTLPAERVLDHVFAWQPNAVGRLADLDVFVDDGVDVVPGIPPDVARLTSSRRLQAPRAKDRQKRKRLLENWEGRLQKAERQARRWRQEVR